MLFKEVSPVDLPDPSLFARLEHARDANLCGFAVDVANMFHNVVLPPWMERLFPMPPIAFGDMPGELQRAVMKALDLGLRPPQGDRFVPHQATLPMGFKWAVHIAHALSGAVIQRALAAAHIGLMRPLTVHRFARTQRHVRLVRGELLLLHVIDVINIVACDLARRDVITVQADIHEQLSLA